MKKSLFMAVMVTLPLSTSLAWANDTHHPDKGRKAATAMTGKDTKMQMGKMQKHMLSMHAQMHKIMDAENPQERKQLMQEHSKMMQDNMQMMQRSMDGEMMGKGKMGGDDKGEGKGGGMKE